MLEKVINKDFSNPLESGESRLDLNHRIEARVQGPNEGGFYSTRDERILHTPPESIRGSWSGERGNSIYRLNELGPKEAKANSILKSKGLDGISYKDGVPDFSKVADATVQIPYMTTHRPTNFEMADRALAAKWNIEAKNGKDNWTASDVRDYRRGAEDRLIWHECSDGQRMDLVPDSVHSSFRHPGGIMECNIRDGKRSANARYKGVKFDD